MQSDKRPLVIRDEGYRILKTDHGHAKAGYRIEHLDDGRYRVSIFSTYDVGDFHGFGSPRIEMQTRDDCVTFFLDRVRKHFANPLTGSAVTECQRTAQKKMLALLETGLFGFLEPEPEDEA